MGRMADRDFRSERRRGASLLSLVRPAAEADPVIDAVDRGPSVRSLAAADPLLEELAALEAFGAPEAPSSDEFERFAEAASRPRAPLRETAEASLRSAAAPPPRNPSRARKSAPQPAAPPASPERAPARSPAPVAPADLPPIRSADDGAWRPLIEPTSVVNGVLRSRRLILATTIAGAALGAALALSTPKKYEAVAELLIDPRDLRITDKDLTQGNGLPSDATLAIVENQVRVITSGSVLTKVVSKLHLDEDPEFNGERGGGLGALVGDMRSLLSRGGGAKADNRFAIAMENLGRSLDVGRAGKTFVVTIGATTEVPEKSATIANELTSAFLETYGTLQSGTAGRATEEITARLAELRASVEAAERKVEDFRAKNDLVDAQGRLISDDEIVKLNEQLTIARARTLELNARAATTKGTGVDDVLGGSLPEQTASPVLTELRAQYAALKQQADSAAVKFGPRHPQSIQISAQLTGARQQIARELRVIASATQVDLKRAVELEQSLAARLAELKVRQAGMNDELVALRELDRDAGSKRAVYEAFLLRARETGEQQGINTANMSVISTAAAPLQPTGASRAATTVLGAILGLMAGVGIGGVRGIADGLRRSRGGTSRLPPPASDDPEPDTDGDPDPDPAPNPEPDPEGVSRQAGPPLRRILEALRGKRRAAVSVDPEPPAYPEPAAAFEPPAEPTEPIPASRQPNPTFHKPSEDKAMGAHHTPFDPTRPTFGHQQPQQPAYSGYAPQPQSQPQPAMQQPAFQQPSWPQMAPQQPSWAQPQQMMPQPHPGAYPQPNFGQWQPAPEGHPAAYYPQAGQPQPYPAYQPQGWAQQPGYNYPQPMPQAYAAPAAYSQPEPEPRPIRETLERRREISTVDEIRDSLREVREAIRELAEARRGAQVDYDRVD